MQYTKIYATMVLWTALFYAYGQDATYVLHGYVKNQQHSAVAGATVRADHQTVLTNDSGYYEIKQIRSSGTQLQVTAIGYKSYQKELRLKSGMNDHDVLLNSNNHEIETVDVLGLTKAQEVNRQAFNVAAIDATKLYNSTLDISGALDRVAGVRVRESGGVGSNFNLSLNGLSGDHVRYFIDGIPMENFGSAFQINNIPINISERIEVYKGVVPMWLGADALGGAVNIVTGDRFRNYVDASYSYGSFNTHRTVVNTALTTKNGFYFQLNAFQNYSDNNYTVDISDEYVGTATPKVKRFHDTYHNESIIANIGVVDKPYADKLIVGLVAGKSYKEIQTGARMISVFGAWHRRGTTLMPTFKYKKNDLFIKGLDVILNGNINLGSDRNIDTVHARFDWYGDKISLDGPGGERSYSLYKYSNHAGIATGTINYRVSDRQYITLNNVFNTFKRTGHDQLNPSNDAYQLAKLSQKNILAVGYGYDIKQKFSVNTFIKYYRQHNVDGDQVTKKDIDQLGYGLATSYYISPNLQLKTSYELTAKMPTPEELFGDVENYDGNFSLKPENSNNFNLGAIYDLQFAEKNRMSLTFNSFYRYATDFIYQRLNTNQTKYISDNREGVRSIGADMDLRYSYSNWFMAGTNMTYQFIQNMQRYEPGYSGESVVYLDQMPNIPYLFGNVDASVTWRDLGGHGNHLNIGANVLYVHEFYLYWPSRGGGANSEKRTIAQQVSLDANAVYSFLNGRYNISFEGKNLTDNRLMDNFSLQKPSRGFYVNLRYFFNK